MYKAILLGIQTYSYAYSDIQIFFSNLEKDETWKKIKEKKYSKIIAHYLLSYLHDDAYFIQNVAQVLAPGGMFFLLIIMGKQ